jgi:uncharacterized protein YdcH (DUF465 family)
MTSMSDRTNETQRILSSQDEQFKNWIEEHHHCETRLTELAGKSQITNEEEVEEKTLKKRKLHLKDQMAARIRGYEEANTARV